MKYTFISLTLLFFLAATLIALQNVAAEEPKTFIPDKALCAKMLQFGKQAYMRGKYLDAKEYFRKAVQADPNSPVAWRYYDLATVFALAEKVEKNTALIAPGVSTRAEPVPGETPPPVAPPPKKAPAKEQQFKIMEDEGC
jgi:tetratricopeptide (TPR) repeat protein